MVCWLWLKRKKEIMNEMCPVNGKDYRHNNSTVCRLLIITDSSWVRKQSLSSERHFICRNPAALKKKTQELQLRCQKRTYNAGILILGKSWLQENTASPRDIHRAPTPTNQTAQGEVTLRWHEPKQE